jgi:hypothetical protein
MNPAMDTILIRPVLREIGRSARNREDMVSSGGNSFSGQYLLLSL